eukprot:GHVO01042861.1.p3 GENE.GHVO01042861.1~~GHVO01042861.1.p3  ORF type:complete len:362 (+),score=70.17 GHVO01042861.1:1632-2717(+)
MYIPGAPPEPIPRPPSFGTATDADMGGAKNAPNANLYIHNVPKDATEQELRSLFSHHGNVERVRLKVNQKIGPHAVYAFVTYTTPQEAEQALHELQNFDMRGRTLRIQYQRSASREDDDKRKGGSKRGDDDMGDDTRRKEPPFKRGKREDMGHKYPPVSHTLSSDMNIPPAMSQSLPLPYGVTIINGIAQLNLCQLLSAILHRRRDEIDGRKQTEVPYTPVPPYPNTDLPIIWRGAMYRNGKKEIPVVLQQVSGNLTGALPDQNDGLNISFRTVYDGVINRGAVRGVCVIRLDNSQYSSQFNEYVEYFNSKQRAGVVSLTNGGHIYVMPPTFPAVAAYRGASDEGMMIAVVSAKEEGTQNE